MAKFPFLNRELSWLSFNERVLQEADDPSLPLFEQIKFLAIFSSNLDEFFRVRVASLRNLLALKDKSKEKLDFSPAELLDDIHKKVFKQQEKLGSIIREKIIPELEKHEIYFRNELPEEDKHILFLKRIFQEEVQPYVQPVLLLKDQISVFLQNKAIYLVVQLKPKQKPATNTAKGQLQYALVNIPSADLPRFFVYQDEQPQKYVFLLDDVIRIGLGMMFPGFKITGSYSIKLTRDAELYIEDEFSGNLLKKIKKGLSRRKTGFPSRFLYDQNMPKSMLNFLTDMFSLEKEDIVRGGRFHNFNDFFNFPNFGMSELLNAPLPVLPSKQLETNEDMFAVLKSKDIMVHYPYQSFDYVIRFLRIMANDPHVTSIDITLYRIASSSQIIQQLIKAAEYGKTVRVFVELKARFDEESNIGGASDLENAGAQVFYSIPGLKVHSKICLVKRKEGNRTKAYAYLATGNFNEKTARIYSDLGLFTTNIKLTSDLDRVFSKIYQQEEKSDFASLLVAPFNMREKFYQLIEQEIANVRNGLPGKIRLKLNSLQDRKMINKLYEAAFEGVRIEIIVRGICCLVTDIAELKNTIKAISIVDRYLEHTRLFIFHNNGNELVFSGSADWMSRNLNRRIEVIFPILDQDLKNELIKIFDIQWKDNVKARVIDKKQKNEYQVTRATKRNQSQLQIYDLLRKKNLPFKRSVKNN